MLALKDRLVRFETEELTKEFVRKDLTPLVDGCPTGAALEWFRGVIVERHVENPEVRVDRRHQDAPGWNIVPSEAFGTLVSRQTRGL